jgi:hypothetical protein
VDGDLDLGLVRGGIEGPHGARRQLDHQQVVLRLRGELQEQPQLAVAGDVGEGARPGVAVELPGRSGAIQRGSEDGRGRLGHLARAEEHGARGPLGEHRRIAVQLVAGGQRHQPLAVEADPVDDPVLVGALVGREDDRLAVDGGLQRGDALGAGHQAGGRCGRVSRVGDVWLGEPVAVGDEQHLAAVAREGRLVVDESIDDGGRLLAQLGVAGRRRAGGDVRRDLGADQQREQGEGEHPETLPRLAAK